MTTATRRINLGDPTTTHPSTAGQPRLPGVGPVPASNPPQTITSLPAAVNLVLYRGDTFGISVAVTDGETGDPADLSQAEPKAQVRVTADAQDVLAEFAAQVEGNVIHLDLTHQQATLLNVGASVWDCQITENGVVTTLCAGTVITTADVTR